MISFNTFGIKPPLIEMKHLICFRSMHSTGTTRLANSKF